LRDPDSGRYDLHPIVRQYAYDRLADKAGVHGCLREYFGARPAPDRVETLADLAPTIELYWHTVGAHHFSALKLFRDRLVYPLYHRFGAYEQVIELMGALFPEGEEKLPQLSSQDAQAWTLSILANSYSLSGQPRRAALLFEMHNGLQDKLGYKLANMLGIELGIKRDLAIGLENLANEQIRLGQLETAGNALRRSIELCREISNELWEAVGHQESGRLFAYEGRFSEVQRELETALKSFHSQSRGQSECIVWASRAVLGLLRGDPKAALAAARESRRLADVKSGEADII